MTRTPIAFALVLLAACNETEVTIGDLQEVMILPATPNRDLDILFVVDSSPSMLEEQAALAANFPLMMDALASLEGGLPNLHIGVITNDLGVMASNGVIAASDNTGAFASSFCHGAGDEGVLRHGIVPELGGELFISDVANPDGSRTRNYTGQLRDVFAGLANVGANGCGLEQPLHAIRRAIKNPLNAGFIRPEANLAIVILTDEDDGSFSDPMFIDAPESQFGPYEFRGFRYGVVCDTGGATPDDMSAAGLKSGCHTNTSSTLVDDVAPYVTYLKNLKGDPNAVMVAVIAGGADPVEVSVREGTPMRAATCAFDNNGVPQTAFPSVRLADFIAGFPNRSAQTTICSADLSSSLASVGVAARRLVGDPCLDAVDVGPEPRCEVLDGPVGAEQLIPPCAGAATGTCWTLAPDASRCGSVADTLRLAVTRTSAPVARTYSRLRCVTR